MGRSLLRCTKKVLFFAKKNTRSNYKTVFKKSKKFKIFLGSGVGIVHVTFKSWNGGIQLLRIHDCFGGYFPLAFNLACYINWFWGFSLSSPLPPSNRAHLRFMVLLFSVGIRSTRMSPSFCCSLRHSSSPSSPSLGMSSPSISMSSPSSPSLGITLPFL